MEQDLALLQNISETLREDPLASQRQLATKANVSAGLMNAILKRFVERGWIMLTNVNARKLAYALTPEGISELSERSRAFARKTFKYVNDYNNQLYKIINSAKHNGKTKIILYGKSYISFLLIYICYMNELIFEERDILSPVDSDCICFVGELEENDIQNVYIQNGCLGLL